MLRGSSAEACLSALGLGALRPELGRTATSVKLPKAEIATYSWCFSHWRIHRRNDLGHVGHVLCGKLVCHVHCDAVCCGGGERGAAPS